MRIFANKISRIVVLLFLLFYSKSGFAQRGDVQSSDNDPVNGTAGLNQKKIVPSMATWHMDSALIDLAATYSPFKVLVNLRSLGRDRDLMNNEVHDQIKKRGEYAKERGISLVADLDIRLALPTFEARFPGELQQMLVVKEIVLKGNDTVRVSFASRNLQDHYQRSYPVRDGSFVKAFKYNLTSQGLVDPVSLKEITDECIVSSATKDSVQLKVPNNVVNSSSHIFVMVSFTYLYPDVFAPHLIGFRDELIRKYADAGLAGAHDDEWGFPNAISEESVQNEYWYTTYRAKAYAENTGGRDLLNDILLMHKGIAGKETERIRAINYFQQMARERNVELEENFYRMVKEICGPDGIVAVHPTWFPYPERREFKKNGLDWWAVKRDWAQTDEVVPFGIRTALAKKWDSPVWYNMFYRYGLPQGSENADDYEDELWSAALAGGRVNNLPHIGVNAILGSDFIRAETRVRLLNHINPTPLNCPVAVVFGHASAMNWVGPAFEDVGMNLADSLWRMGIPTDLIPSSEIENNSLQVDQDGYIRYGRQRYAAVVLYNPEFENRSTATFFNRAAKGKTRLYRVGGWTMDFNGNRLDGISLLPKPLQAESSIESIMTEIPRLLEDENIPSQTPATRFVEGFGHGSYAPPTTGFSYLLDGTLVQVTATRDSAGDTLRSKMKTGKYDVEVDAIGVAAVRLDRKGNLEALAAGGLKSLETARFKLFLDERVDLALWKNEEGAWEGLIQGWTGDIPASLRAITSKWQRLDLPVPYPRVSQPALKNALLVEGKSMFGSEELLTDIDGNTYLTLKAGNQTWMAENLRTSRFNDGEPITSPGGNKSNWNSNRSGAYAWYENDSAKYEELHGKLYNWHAVQTNKLCPAGWRVPNVQEWTDLINYLDSAFVKNDSPAVTNRSPGVKGFNPLPGGYRSPYGTYFGLGRNGFWWSSSGTRNRVVWDQKTKYIYIINDREQPANQGICIRCIKEMGK